MSLFNELKRRNVFKVALAYLVASWLVLQITDVLMGVLSLPETAGKFVFMLLVIGFIPAMVFAWAYEVTPEGIKRESEVDRSESMTHETAARLNRTTIVLLIAVAVMVVVDRFVPEGDQKGSEPFSQQAVDSGPEQIDEKRALTPPDATPSVAVLPFVNMSSDAENEYFSDGITEELLNLLVRVEGLRVPSRTSSFAFKGQNTDIRDIARQLEVNHILEGSVRKADNQVRITAQLIDVTTDTHLWSETYDREFKDIFVIQDEIASNIVGALREHISLESLPSFAMPDTRGSTSQERQRPTENLEAYNLYLQGLYQFRQRGDLVRDAEISLRRAVELDPDFAEAWALLGLNYTVQPNYLYIPLDAVEDQALDAARRVEQLDPSMVEPELIRGNIASKQGDLLQAIQHYERAIELAPRNALARLWFSIALLEGGYLSDAAEQADIARSLDPAAGIVADWQSRAHYMSGNRELGLRYGREGYALGRTASALVLAQDLITRGVEFELDLVQDSNLPVYWESWKRAAAALRDPSLINETLAWAEALSPEESIEQAWSQHVVSSLLGQPSTYLDEAIALMSLDATILTTVWWPPSKRFRVHPAFKGFARESGLLELWQARGWPDLCRPVGDDDFECD